MCLKIDLVIEKRTHISGWEFSGHRVPRKCVAGPVISDSSQWHEEGLANALDNLHVWLSSRTRQVEPWKRKIKEMININPFQKDNVHNWIPHEISSSCHQVALNALATHSFCMPDTKKLQYDKIFPFKALKWTIDITAFSMMRWHKNSFLRDLKLNPNFSNCLVRSITCTK